MRLNLSKHWVQSGKDRWKPLIKLILIWLLLDLLLFLSGYLLYPGNKGFLPFDGIVNVNKEGLRSIFFLNHNHNPFRLCGDWLILSLIASFLIGNIPRKLLLRLLTFTYFILFAYSLYYFIYHFIYGTHPYFLSNALLISNVFPIFLGTLGISNWIFWLAVVLIITGLFFLIWFVINKFLDYLEAGRTHPMFVPLLILISIYTATGTYLYHDASLEDHRLNVQWWTPRIIESTRPSPKHFWRSDPLKIQRLKEQCASMGRDSIDIYLLVIESYGSVATEAPQVADTFRAFLSEAENRLSKEGWHAVSGYSLAPIKGGRSWLSFSTIMTGQTINNQYAYEQFLSKESDYPHMIRCLNRKGYRTTWMNTMRSPEEMDLKLQDSLMRLTWECDEWIQYGEIDYSGRRFDPYGGIPDQYALNYYREQSRQYQEQDRFLFFINTNSHSPWFEPPPVVRDYRSLNQTGGAWRHGSELSSYSNYERSLRYQLTYLSQYIRNWGDGNDLFLLVGDHQPPAKEFSVEGIIDKSTVPYHLISKNPRLLEPFRNRNAVTGLLPQREDPVRLKHEDIYELLLKCLK